MVSLSSFFPLPVRLYDSEELFSKFEAKSLLESLAFLSLSLFRLAASTSFLTILWIQHLTMPKKIAAMRTDVKNWIWWTLSLPVLT